MYNAALFLHLIGVVVLVGAVTTTLLTTLRVQTARSVAELRTLTAVTKRIEPFIAPGMVLIIVTGLYMVSQHGYRGSILWSAGWVDTALFITVLLSVIGRTVEARDAKRLHAAIDKASDKWPQADLRKLQLTASPIYTVFFGTSQVIALLYLMTNRPGLVASIAACVIVGIVSAIVATIRIRSVRRSVH
ncbi:MAG: hypothetical protein JWN80_2270 [Microbacteriaceae bacterium]|nr:hypothetical protein [Microbacteriaceae bacterium]